MKNNTLTLKTNPENLVKQPLDEIVRLGAQELLTTALEVEVNLFVERYQYIIKFWEFWVGILGTRT